jgi:hypothetical protein
MLKDMNSQLEKAVAPFRLRLKRMVLKATAEASKEMGKLPKPRRGKRAQAITKIIQENDFGCAKEAVASLVEAITGEEVAPLEDGKGLRLPHKTFAALVPMKNPNCHDYPHNVAAVTVGLHADKGVRAVHAIKGDGRMGNWLSTDAENTRLASKDEIERYFTNLPTAGLLLLAEAAK